jgi:hypothetical protein
MKAIISTNYSDTYLYFLPIVTWAWNKLGVDVICFMPNWQIDETFTDKDHDKLILIDKVNMSNNVNCEIHRFVAPKHKQATYAQCVRLYGACLDLPEDEILIVSDIDMAVFKIPEINGGFAIHGADLVPKGQYPMCYITASVSSWRVVLGEDKTYQEHLDALLGEIECDSFRGNYWGKDQETAYSLINPHKAFFKEIPRSNGQNQFGQNRYDRDDAFILDRLSPDTIDFHMPRPGYEDKNFEIILTILKYHYPEENLQWMWDYRNEYIKLL